MDYPVNKLKDSPNVLIVTSLLGLVLLGLGIRSIVDAHDDDTNPVVDVEECDCRIKPTVTGSWFLIGLGVFMSLGAFLLYIIILYRQ